MTLSLQRTKKKISPRFARKIFAIKILPLHKSLLMALFKWGATFFLSNGTIQINNIQNNEIEKLISAENNLLSSTVNNIK